LIIIISKKNQNKIKRIATKKELKTDYMILNIPRVKNSYKIFTFKTKVSVNPNKELKNKFPLNKTLIIP